MSTASENATVADILKELRGIKGGQHTNGGLSFERWRARCQFADDYADRIEAAHRREIAELRECLRVSSNAMEMVVRWLGRYPKWQDELKNLVAKNRKALEGAKDAN